MNLEGKTAFITGGGGGIGNGMAQAFAERGMKLVLADIDPARARDQATAFGYDAIAVELDVTSSASWASARQVARDRFGSVGVLCNNAGVSLQPEPPSQDAPDDFARVIELNTIGRA